MAANTSQQELTANGQLLIAQVAQMLTALEAMNLIRDLKAKSEGAWTKFDERINHGEVTIAEIETKVEGLKINNGNGDQRQMRLINDESVQPPLFSGDRKKYISWARSMKAYLDSHYSGFRKMLDWAEREEAEITTEMVDGTQWRHARESNAQLFNLLTTYTLSTT